MTSVSCRFPRWRSSFSRNALRSCRWAFATPVRERPAIARHGPSAHRRGGKSYCAISETYNWDSHAVNCHIFKDTKHKLGFFDQAISALIADLYDRGLDKRVMVVVTGEFGRTPKLEYTKNRPGRDHWPLAMSVLVSGGGVRHGQVIGSTTAKAEVPKDRHMTPNHLWATVFDHLKLDYKNASFLDGTGRPMPMLTDGEPIPELV